ncbi:hypothetical protein E1301_Tti004668 [Triplophysa tibetana]|uniref:Uncharacterized protein n=1 Tax=Triplophysa tibetana TaxID=1572043 RepID=A0A5A9N9N9_9TELE|nr:hypothetical protein E1301_Tti004668 [Triplophysa tibetana]
MGKDKKDEREIRRELLYLRDSDSRPLKRGKMVARGETEISTAVTMIDSQCLLQLCLSCEPTCSVLVLRIDQVSDALSKPKRPAKEPVAMTTEEFLHFNFYPRLGNAQQCMTVSYPSVCSQREISELFWRHFP